MELQRGVIFKYRRIFLWFAALIVLSVIGFFNRYIFIEHNVPYLLVILIFLIFALRAERIPKKVFLSGTTLMVFIFIAYMWIRLYHPPVESHLDFDISRISDGKLDIFHQIIYYLLFIVSAVLFYNQNRFSLFLWVLISGYLLAFIGRCSLDGFGAFILHNNSAGFVIYTFSPFLFFIDFKNNNFLKFLPHIVFLFCVYWLCLIGTRGAIVSSLLFYLLLMIWPKICRSRLRFYGAFWVIVLSVLALMGIYMALLSVGGGGTLNEISMQVFKKGIDTRIYVWNVAVELIKQNPLLGFGTDVRSQSFLFPEFLRTTSRQIYLTSASTYMEILLRLGIVGLVVFIFIYYSIWHQFYEGRLNRVVRVAGSFLLSSLFYMAALQYWIFNIQLRSGFGWIILGIGVGASFRASRCPLKKSYRKV